MKKIIKKIKRMPAGPKWIALCVLGWLIWSVLDSFLNKQKILDSLFKKIPSSLLGLEIPDIFFLVALIVLSFFTFYPRLKKPLLKNRNLIFANNAYWNPRGALPAEGPFCPHCYQGTAALNRMVNTERFGQVRCPNCGLEILSSPPDLLKVLLGG